VEAFFFTLNDELFVGSSISLSFPSPQRRRAKFRNWRRIRKEMRKIWAKEQKKKEEETGMTAEMRRRSLQRR